MPKTEDKPLIEKRKTPRQVRAQETVEAILEAAAQLLEREETASTNAIAIRAGVSIGTVYQYFPNGPAILAAIAEREQARVGDAIIGALAGIDPAAPQEAVRQAIRALLSAFGTRQNLRKRILLKLLPDHARDVDTQFNDNLARAMQVLLRDKGGAAFDHVDEVVTFTLSRALIGAVRAAIMEERVPLSDPVFEDTLTRMALAVLNPR